MMQPVTPRLSGFGSTLFPVRDDLPGGGQLTSAGDLDRGKTALYELIFRAVNAECGDSWRALLQQADKEFFLVPDATDDSRPIMDILTVIPNSQNLTQRMQGWPLLAVYREGEPSTEAETMKLSVTKQNFSIDYIMGPVGTDSQDRFGDFVLQVVNAIKSVIKLGSHPAHRNGAPAFQGIFSNVVVLSQSGPACSEVTDQQAGAGYFGGSVTIQVTEREISQANSELGTFERDAFYYDSSFPGYGDAVPSEPAQFDTDGNLLKDSVPNNFVTPAIEGIKST